jgi:hypothetical protein
VNQPPIRLIIPYISFIYSTSTTTLAIQITKRLRGCGVIRLQRYVENLLTNAKDRTKSLKQIKYLINLPNQTNQALRLNKQTNQRPDFCLICLFTRLTTTTSAADWPEVMQVRRPRAGLQKDAVMELHVLKMTNLISSGNVPILLR